MHLRLFAALSGAALLGALSTGLYAVAVDATSVGFVSRAQSVAPKALGLGVALLALAALGAALAGRHLARSIEQLAEVAACMAEGLPTPALGAAHGVEVRRITRALAALRRQAEERPYATANLRDACHDLKTPLAAVRATIEVLEDGALEDPVAARRFLSNLSRSAAALDRALGDRLALARLQTGVLSVERATTVEQLVASAVVRASPLAAARGVSVRSDGAGGAPFRCDAAAIARALDNLIENAVDATPGGQVRVSVLGASRDTVALEVDNEPAFVAPEARPHLFERGASGKRGGSGLGLAIARAAVEAHGGRVTFVELGPPRVRVRVELPRG